MAELDIKGFVTPEQDYSGLYKIADKLEAQKAAKAKAEEEDKARKATLGKEVEAYIDPKNFQTKTIYDQQLTKGVHDILQDSYDLINSTPGLTSNMLKATMNKRVSDLSQATEKIKEIERKRKVHRDVLSKNPAVDMNLFDNEYTKHAYYNEDGSLKSYDQINDEEDFGDKTINESDIYTDAGFPLFSQKAPKDSYSEDFTTRSPSGHTIKGTKEIKIASYLQPIYDASGKKIIDAEPKNELFTDDGLPQMHNFMHDGKQQSEPIKIVTDDVFNSAMSDLNIAPKIRAEVAAYCKQNNIPIADPQAEKLAKALVYQKLNENRKSAIDFGTKTANTYALPKSSSGGKDAGSEYRNVYRRFKDRMDEGQSTMGTGGLYSFTLNTVEPDAGNIVMKYINERYPGAEYNASQIRVVTNPNTGRLEAVSDRKSDKGKLLMPLTQEDIDIKGQFSKGGKETATKKAAGIKEEVTDRPKFKAKTTGKATGKKKTKEEDPLGLDI